MHPFRNDGPVLEAAARLEREAEERAAKLARRERFTRHAANGISLAVGTLGLLYTLMLVRAVCVALSHLR